MQINSGDVVTILQSSLAPGLLISAAALLLTSLTNRIARPAARIRSILKDELHKKGSREQIKILYYRARVIRLAIIFVILSIFSSILTVMSIEVGLVFARFPKVSAIISFTMALVFLLVAIVCYLHDVYLTLHGLRIEMKSHDIFEK